MGIPPNKAAVAPKQPNERCRDEDGGKCRESQVEKLGVKYISGTVVVFEFVNAFTAYYLLFNIGFVTSDVGGPNKEGL